jgi:hypothetical protein
VILEKRIEMQKYNRRDADNTEDVDHSKIMKIPLMDFWT